MTDSIKVRKTYKYRLYRCGKRDQYLHQQIDIAGKIWNHSLALQRRYYRLTGKYIHKYTLQEHIAKLRNQRFPHWQQLDAQAVQDVIDRLDKTYQRFFKWVRHEMAQTRQGPRMFPPRFKKIRKYKSFTLKQTSWKLLGGNRVQIRGRTHKFAKHREINGQIKTVTIKRDAAGRLWVCFSVIEEVSVPKEVSTGEIGGFDFGLKTFLVDQDNHPYTHPGFLRPELRTLKRLNRSLSRKKKSSSRAGSRNRSKARLKLSRFHSTVANKRRDFHFKLANELCDKYDVLCFEDLNLNGMKALWGRKVSDLGFGQFMDILEWVAVKRGKQVVKIDRWYPSTQTCSACGCVNSSITLRDREWVCPDCKTHHYRDQNAAKNIIRVGSSTLGLAVIRPSFEGSRA